MTPTRLLLTPGEPAGIGPELAVRLAQSPPGGVELIAIANPALLRDTADALGLPLTLVECDERTPRGANLAGTLKVWPQPLAMPATPGRLEPRNAPYVLATLRRAVAACVAGQADALVTGPVHKGIVMDAAAAGLLEVRDTAQPFTGHTEYLALLTGAPLPVMLLAAGSGPDTVPERSDVGAGGAAERANRHSKRAHHHARVLRVALATTHLPLAEVPQAITRDSLTATLRVLRHDLVHRFGLEAPRILVCGLNPHAGEGGHLGREEITTITPVLDALRAEGFLLEGPLPADTLFTPAVLARGDAVLAMYHDQGLPVLKHAGFGEAVNITLGLPIVRTSVDHGVALDLAGRGVAHPGSLQAAVAAALDLVRRRAAA